MTVSPPVGTSNNRLAAWAKKFAADALTTFLTSPVANASLADMASPRVKARGTAGTGPPEDIAIGNGLVLDATSLRTLQQMSVTVDGSGLKLSGDSASPGNSLYYGTDGGGTKGFFALPAGGGLTLITSASFPAAATWSFTGLAGYKMLMVSCRGISQSSGTSRGLNIELSGNNGSSFGGVKNYLGGTGIVTGGAAFPLFFITRADQTNNQVAFGVTGQTTAVLANLVETGSIGPINAFRLSWSGAATNFTAGDIDVYGLK